MALPIVLASTSRYRRQLLERLPLKFQTVSPDVDESPLEEELPEQLAMRLAELKARKGLQLAPGSLIIGSDQVAECRGELLGKPGSPERARSQLMRLQGQTVFFHTAVCLTDGEVVEVQNVRTTVRLRTLSKDQIQRYVALENPIDCAGAFKSEALGIALIESMQSNDPTALIGLPLIATIGLLEKFGHRIL
ncbi:MAG: Maf family nucleotide pyrophosphatase [Wenzhouxiangella sp.]|jgi:septum formation protein|nr:Maf family nucleotide pyrophosphatase [Wenzhouxiangella sp.]